VNTTQTDIYQFQADMSQRLALWSGVSMGAAAVIALLYSHDLKGRQAAHDPQLWRGVASQFAGWGAIDLGVALFGLQATRQRAADPDAHTPTQRSKARANLGKILWINTGLDVGYIAGGAILARTRGQHRRFWRGAGWGVIIQGGFLLSFDLIHALMLRK
jgi:hypothetical protein